MAPAAYRGDEEHIADELRWLDAVLRLRTACFRECLRAAPAPTSYISHEEVDWLLGDASPAAEAAAAGEVTRLQREVSALDAHVHARVRRSIKAGVELGLVQLTERFGLSAFEARTVVICLAPELDRRYDKLYAYLQDDIARKRPSAELVLDLLCDDAAERWSCRPLLTRQARLFRAGILEEALDPGSPSGSSDLARFLGLAPRILGFLTGAREVDPQVRDLLSPGDPSSGPGDTELADQLGRVIERSRLHDAPLLLYLHGPAGVGRRRLAASACERLGLGLLAIDGPSLLRRGDDFEELLRLAFREALLTRAAVYLADAEPLFADELQARLTAVARAAAEQRALVFLAGERPRARPRALGELPFHAMALPAADRARRTEAWREGLAPYSAPATWATELGTRFRLTPGQVRAAVAAAAFELEARGDGDRLELVDLASAARRQSRHRLGDLAVQIEPRAGWRDLVLPADRLEQLREICGQVRHQHEVLEDWGFARKVSRASGVSVLFSGPPGTGKTLAIEVIAGELELDLYKIDLSGVVSKYIGETEKNLARIFQEAEAGNSILFFDEADALFGKRTKVSDAHDRYANIETSYLLQRMEGYDGVVVLATNLRENLDEAFTRRIRFVVDFPFPDEASRRKIWEGHLPGEAPLSPDLDLDYLARELKIAGGSIRNIVLGAAFLAADDGGRIDMRHVLHATQREFEKIGKQWGGLDVVGGNPGRRR